MQQHIFWSLPLGPGEGPKGQISLNIIKFQLQSQFQSLCVFSHMKDIKHIISDGIFIWPPGSCPRGGTWGNCGGVGKVKKKCFSKFNQIWCVSYLPEWHMHCHHFLGPPPLGPWGGAKGSNIIKFALQSQFQTFLNQTLGIFSQMKDI